MTDRELKMYHYGKGLWYAGDIGTEELHIALEDFKPCITLDDFQAVAEYWQDRAEMVEHNRRCCQIVEDRVHPVFKPILNAIKGG